MGHARQAVAAGVRVYEATPMLGLQRTLPAVVTTPSGSVTADRVVLASGAHPCTGSDQGYTMF